MALTRQRPAPGLIHHSDRGIQYAAEACRGALATAGITPSWLGYVLSEPGIGASDLGHDLNVVRATIHQFGKVYLGGEAAP